MKLYDATLPIQKGMVVCLINDSDIGEVKSGEFRTIRITRVLEHDLLGKIVK